ncbi:DUF2812 domain-containing protein [Bacillus sp. SB49]|uniref:DUF2812 domain-containing protein n=1 Tax=Bacillaceae TaxID=186817 RepID=UPI0002A4EF3B|nr:MULTISPECIES: DUF2812 domain-containing protein [Bacillaceae]ELK45655.1 hypothetical protein D479_13977 [Halobacillus sp. BAB-2008]QHT46181.1 DUF2812 domain-containing protein [Bacillus sp. SB49]
MYKRTIRIFFTWQDNKEAEWLQSMAKDGWHLARYRFGLYTFIQGEPGEYVYKLDYRNGTDEDIDSYLALFEEAGWEKVERFHGWHYFRKPLTVNEDAPDIYTDHETEAHKYRLLVNLLIPLFLVTLVLAATIFQPGVTGHPIYTALKVLYGFLIALYVISIVQLKVKINKLTQNHL